MVVAARPCSPLTMLSVVSPGVRSPGWNSVASSPSSPRRGLPPHSLACSESPVRPHTCASLRLGFVVAPSSTFPARGCVGSAIGRFVCMRSVFSSEGPICVGLQRERIEAGFVARKRPASG